MSQINKTDTCWLWTGHTTGDYGRYGIERKKVYAHRYSYTIHKGEIPEGHCVRHTCDETLCVNPDHLLTGTQQDNMNDKKERGRCISKRGKGVKLRTVNGVTIDDVFMTHVNKTDTCWLWTGTTACGYGQCNRNNKNVKAHRYSYIIHKGEIPEGHGVRHTCDEPLCVNPDHLLTGTQQDNMNDKKERGRQNPPSGERNSLSKLNNDDVIEIRILRGFGFTYDELGKMYNVSISSIFNIINNKTWTHI